MKRLPKATLKDWLFASEYRGKDYYIRLMFLRWMALTVITAFYTIMMLLICIAEASPALWLGISGTILFFWVIVAVLWYFYRSNKIRYLGKGD